jgi:antitoxin component YwqK of YwqJK toxin-antitoxin module
MKPLILLFIIFLLPGFVWTQKIALIRDSIMNTYMESGFATKNFRPTGKTDANNLRQGKWKDYEPIEGGSYQLVNEAPMKTIGYYLFYGEGEFIDDKRTGAWTIYVIEDKSFKKILSQKLNYTDGKPDGSFEYFYPDGKVAQTGSYNNGDIEGESIIYFPGGNTFGKQFFVAGNKNGRQQYFFPEGKLSFVVNYTKGLKEGKYESYYKDGTIQESAAYVTDSLDGVYRYYYPSGKLWTEKFYKVGLTMNITCTNDKNGHALDKGTLKDGNGYINYYTEEGKIYLVVTFKDGKSIKEEQQK